MLATPSQISAYKLVLSTRSKLPLASLVSPAQPLGRMIAQPRCRVALLEPALSPSCSHCCLPADSRFRASVLSFAIQQAVDPVAVPNCFDPGLIPNVR